MTNLTKTCCTCNSTQSISNFYTQKNHKYGVMSMCKACFNKACIKRWIQRKIHYVELLGGKCQNCGLSLKDSHYSVFEFHHKVPTKKEASWNKIRLWPDDKIHTELSKCILLCANCHRLKHVKNDEDFPEQ